MGLIIRHAAFPYIDGETLPAKDLETDVARAYAEIAGNMNDQNVRPGADFDGAKLLAGSLPGSKIRANVLTTGKILDTAVIGQKIADDTLETEVMAAGSLTDSAMDTDSAPPSADAPGVTIASVTINTGAEQGLVMLCALVLADLTVAGSGLNLRIERDGTSIFDWDLARVGLTEPGGADPYSVFHVDTGYDLSAAVVYDLIGDLYTGHIGAVALDDLIFVAVELRR